MCSAHANHRSSRKLLYWTCVTYQPDVEGFAKLATGGHRDDLCKVGVSVSVQSGDEFQFKLAAFVARRARRQGGRRHQGGKWALPGSFAAAVGLCRMVPCNRLPQ